MSEGLVDEPAYLSVDLFGLTTIREDDMNIGQIIEDAALYVDYICPMVYPSHYPSGHNNYDNPAEYPYEIVYEAISTANQRLSMLEGNRAAIRAWIQDFDMGAIYDARMINKQITAVEDAKGFGWLVWNARNVYTWNAY